ncbi:MAG: tetratricopeptide repeat protein [Betaproteobacteria bacterium]
MAAAAAWFALALALGAAVSGCAALGMLNTGLAVIDSLSKLSGHVADANVQAIGELEAKKDWPGMLKMANASIAKDSNNPDWWLIAGYAHTQMGQHQQAIPCYQTTIRLSPDDLYPWNLLAQSYRATNQAEMAIRTLDRALLIKDGTATTYFLLGESYRDMNLYVHAIPNYAKAIETDPKLAEAWYAMGVSYARLGKRAELPAIHAQLARIDPPLADQFQHLVLNR